MIFTAVLAVKPRLWPKWSFIEPFEAAEQDEKNKKG